MGKMTMIVSRFLIVGIFCSGYNAINTIFNWSYSTTLDKFLMFFAVGLLVLLLWKPNTMLLEK